jgi:hypothetical protein
VEFHTSEGWEMADPSWASRFLKGLWFGRNDGRHLSYGEAEQESQVYAAMLRWAESHGRLIGAMSAPLKSAATADSEDVSITPSATVEKGWDGRWVNMLALDAMAALLLGFYERRRKRKHRYR